jgi:hypothetical protein
MRKPLRLLTYVIAFAVGACDGDSVSEPVIELPPATTIVGSGAIAAKVTEFATLLGEPANGGTAGEQSAGRREITWDGAGANPFDNRNDFPATFFNTNVKSGAVFTTPGLGFRNDSTLFVDINPGYATEHAPFSPKKIFSPVGSNVMDVLFQVAGQPTPAKVTGFGAVFSDVDVGGGTTLDFFSTENQLLLHLVVPARTDASGLSFAGAKFANAIVARVRITLGNAPLGPATNDVSSGGTSDIVVVDNFLFGEPKRIP